MTTLANIDLSDQTVEALDALCKETHLSASKVIEAAILAYRRQAAHQRYFGAGLLDDSHDHPSATKQSLKKILKEKYGYST